MEVSKLLNRQKKKGAVNGQAFILKSESYDLREKDVKRRHILTKSSSNDCLEVEERERMNKVTYDDFKKYFADFRAQTVD